MYVSLKDPKHLWGKWFEAMYNFRVNNTRDMLK